MKHGLENVLEGLPWAIPGVVLAVVVATLLARPVARRLREPVLTAWALLASLGAILAMTLTPSPDFLDMQGCDLTLTPLSLATLFAVNDRSLNVLLFVPLGLAIGALRPRHRAAWLVLAIALPPAIEVAQLVLEPLQRTCQATDVLDNWLGLGIGLAAGAVGGWIWRLRPRHTTERDVPPAPPM
jgi:glycopeptide antibiotics resistance protein